MLEHILLLGFSFWIWGWCKSRTNCLSVGKRTSIKILNPYPQHRLNHGERELGRQESTRGRTKVNPSLPLWMSDCLRQLLRKELEAASWSMHILSQTTLETTNHPWIAVSSIYPNRLKCKCNYHPSNIPTVVLINTKFETRDIQPFACLLLGNYLH